MTVLRVAHFGVAAALVFGRPHPSSAQGLKLALSDPLRMSGEYSTVSMIAVAFDGAIAVAQAGEYSLTLLNHQGKRIASFGRRGGGPSEFASIGALGSTGNQFWVYDPLSARITWLTGDGSLIRTERAPAVGILRTAGLSYIRPRTAGLDQKGGVILFADKKPAVGTTPFLSTMEFGAQAAVYLGENASPPRVLAETEDTPACVVAGPKSAAVVPYCTGPLLAARTDARGVVLLRFDSPRLSRARVHSLNTRGDTVFSLAIPIQPAPLPSRLVDSVLRPLRENPVYRGQVVAPRYYPPIRRLIVGRDGSVWLEEHQSTNRHQWLVISPQGKIVGRLTVPGNFRIITAEVGTIWGAEVDEDDVPTIVRYRVR